MGPRKNMTSTLENVELHNFFCMQPEMCFYRIEKNVLKFLIDEVSLKIDNAMNPGITYQFLKMFKKFGRRSIFSKKCWLLFSFRKFCLGCHLSIYESFERLPGWRSTARFNITRLKMSENRVVKLRWADAITNVHHNSK